ncbi:hypothetical protein Tsubulata_026332, partial [Turnera subulata]
MHTDGLKKLGNEWKKLPYEMLPVPGGDEKFSLAATIHGGQVLNFHCKSKNDDLGVQLLHPGEEWMFRFTVNIWETTLYFCRFWWGAESHWFDIYKASRDKWPPVCYDDNKYWEVKQSGPCFIRCFASPHQT